MQLLNLGINHKSANIGIREQLSFDKEGASKALHSLLQHQSANEAVLLSTCNRTEIYATTYEPERLKKWFFSQYRGSENLNSHFYHHSNQDCVKHLMRVACGLDSMVIGEPQILGQLKQAYDVACQAGSVNSFFKQLFPAAFSASKQIRTESKIGSNPITLAYSIVHLSKRIFSEFTRCQLLLIGAGSQIELIANYLLKHKINHFFIANRNLEHAQALARLVGGRAIQMSDIPIYLSQSDIVISATSSQLPLIGKGMVESALKVRKHNPILMIDLAVPRDIEPEVSQLEDIYLYNIDDLQEIIQQNLKNRQLAADHAEGMIENQTENVMRKLRLYQAGNLIQQFRYQVNQLRDKELEKAINRLNRGEDPSLILRTFSKKLTNKILHQPTIKLRQTVGHQQQEVLKILEELLT